MFIIALVLPMLVVDICHSETITCLSCDQLPKHNITSNQILVANSPYKVGYALSPLLKCAATIVSKPTCRPATACDGTGVNIIGCSSTVVHYKVHSDNTTMEVFNCKTGSAIWHLSAAQFDSTGGFYCIYSCNGAALREFKCASNRNGTSTAELEAVEMARKVPNGNLIYNVQDNCPPSIGC